MHDQAKSSQSGRVCPPASVKQPVIQSGFSVPGMLIAMLVVAVLIAVGYSVFRQLSTINEPERFASDLDHFKYGSIGADTPDGNGLPYWVWRTLPEVCPDKLPGGYASLGVISEPGMDRPIGFSKRNLGLFDAVGLNCAACHTASVRETVDGEQHAYVGATSHQLDLWGYFDFLFSCGTDDRFTPDRVLELIGNHTKLSFFDKIIYRQAVKQTKDVLKVQSKKVAWVPERPLWGPGRVDTFNPYKTLVFGADMSNDQTIGTADFMTIWNQQKLEGQFVHWDGNNNSVAERNLSAAIGAGATPDTLDHENLNRIRDWIWTLQPPKYPYTIDYKKAARGQLVWKQECAACHSPGGEYVGQVMPVGKIGTDPERAIAFDEVMVGYMNRIGEGHPFRFKQFRQTDGYVNSPLDGVWLRAPYLHNGSVPTLRDLLTPAAQRPVIFYKGNDVFDANNVGYVSSEKSGNGRDFFEFDTRLRGNGNSGHSYGTKLAERDKDALIEYMKSF